MKAMFEDDVKVRITPIFGEWKPSKPIGLQLIAPWIGVLDDEQVINFSNRYIMPKLSGMIQRLGVEPSSQDIEPLNILFRWAETLPAPYGPKQATSILMQHFVHKLLGTL